MEKAIVELLAWVLSSRNHFLQMVEESNGMGYQQG
jgi:hypothetical protein